MPRKPIDKKLLVINFEMNLRSPVLAWQYLLVQELGMHYKEISVLTHHIGTCISKPNIKVRAFPKLFQRRFIRSLGGMFILDRWAKSVLLQEKPNACFMHMNYSWATRLHKYFRRYQIPTLLWYAHGTVTEDLKQALSVVDKVVSSTPEGFRLPTDKINFIGQAIDINLFKPQKRLNKAKDIIYVGRISQKKRVHLIIEAFYALEKDSPSLVGNLCLIGPTLTNEDKKYLLSLKTLVMELSLEKKVMFLGPLTIENIPSRYRTAFVHVNLSQTGSMDKTVMESLSCGCPVLTAGEAYRSTLVHFPDLILKDDHPKTIAAQIKFIYLNPDLFAEAALRNLIIGSHDVETFIQKLISQLETIS